MRQTAEIISVQATTWKMVLGWIAVGGYVENNPGIPRDKPWDYRTDASGSST